MKVYCYASCLGGHYRELLGSMHNKIEYVVHLEHQRGWHWDKLVDYQLEVARAHPDEALVFADLWDSLFIGDPLELEREIHSMSVCKVQASKVLWPPVKRTDWFKKNGTDWKYVNGSFVCGTGDMIRRAIEYGKKVHPVKPLNPAFHIHDYPNNDNNGRMWTEVYLDGYCEIDSYCRIAQQLNRCDEGELAWDGKRIRNLKTGSKPHFLHASNSTWGMIPEEVIKNATSHLLQ